MVVRSQQQKNETTKENYLWLDGKCGACTVTNLLVVGNFSDPGVHFHAGLSDCKAIMGEAAELECKVSSEDCEGIWYKDGEEVSPESERCHYPGNISGH